MGAAEDPEVLAKTMTMVESSVYSSVVAAQVSAELLSPKGLVILPGAAAAWGPTAWSLPYGTAKAAVHHLVRSLAQGGPVTIGLAPQILDTPQNRAAMPDADRSTWASLEEVSEQIEKWCVNPETRRLSRQRCHHRRPDDAAVALYLSHELGTQVAFRLGMALFAACGNAPRRHCTGSLRVDSLPHAERTRCRRGGVAMAGLEATEELAKEEPRDSDGSTGCNSSPGAATQASVEAFGVLPGDEPSKRQERPAAEPLLVISWQSI
eukprot:g26811.t1